jgi:hypothetical protein
MSLLLLLYRADDNNVEAQEREVLNAPDAQRVLAGSVVQGDNSPATPLPSGVECTEPVDYDLQTGSATNLPNLGTRGKN